MYHMNPHFVQVLKHDSLLYYEQMLGLVLLNYLYLSSYSSLNLETCLHEYYHQKHNHYFHHHHHHHHYRHHHHHYHSYSLHSLIILTPSLKNYLTSTSYQMISYHRSQFSYIYYLFYTLYHLDYTGYPMLITLLIHLHYNY